MLNISAAEWGHHFVRCPSLRFAEGSRKSSSA